MENVVICECIYGYSSLFDRLIAGKDDEQRCLGEGQLEDATYPYILFNYCPMCGKKIDREHSPQSTVLDNEWDNKRLKVIDQYLRATYILGGKVVEEIVMSGDYDSFIAMLDGTGEIKVGGEIRKIEYSDLTDPKLWSFMGPFRGWTVE